MLPLYRSLRENERFGGTGGTGLIEKPSAALPNGLLRPYQERAVAAVREARENGLRRVFFTAPTGTGKTTIFVAVIAALGMGRPSLVVAHREELLEQAAQRVRSLLPGLSVGIEGGNRRASPWCDVVVGSVQTLGRPGSSRLEGLNPGLLIVDECHHAPAPGYKRTFERFGCYEPDGAFLVGCTATAKRLDRINLRNVFEAHVFDYPIRQAMEDGYLCEVRGYAVVSRTDLSKVHVTAGDFNQKELSRAVNQEARTLAVIKHFREVASDRKTIVFCVDVAHAKEAARMWREAGFVAAHVDGEMRPEVRRAVMDRFRSGAVQVLTNCEIATEGVDVPDTSCIVMLRPTQSWALYVQMAGRGLRPVKADCIIIDVVDNCDRHSLASVPAILDLPPGIDLEGRTLKETAKAMEQLAEAASFMSSYEPATFTELQTMLRSVDLFGRVDSPPAVEANSRLSWLLMPGDYYLLQCGAGCQARLDRDGLGLWKLSVRGPEINTDAAFSPDIAESLRAADERVIETWPEVGRIAGRNCRWRSDSPTDKQKSLLRKLRQPQEAIDRMSRGQASSLISILLAKGGGA